MVLKDRITSLLKEKKLDLRRDLLPFIEMTEPGYYAMFRNESMKFKTLEKILEFLGITINEFFGTPSSNSYKKKDIGRKNVIIDLDPGDIFTVDIQNRRIEIVKK